VNLRLVAIVSLLLLAAAGTWWLLRQTALQGTQTARLKTHAPDYYFTDAMVTTLDPKGKPESQLTAPRMLHHPDDDSVEVFSPNMLYLPPDGPAWTLQADHAIEPSGGRIVQFDGHVKVQHPGEKGGPPLMIDTDRITLDLNAHTAVTDAPVQITQGGNHMTALGLDAYLDDNRLLLRTEVRGLYVPPK
jgi:lipopolysaccharide export system protein LptC